MRTNRQVVTASIIALWSGSAGLTILDLFNLGPQTTISVLRPLVISVTTTATILAAAFRVMGYLSDAFRLGERTGRLAAQKCPSDRPGRDGAEPK